MLPADSRARFEIEGERPPRNRLERWGKAVLHAAATAFGFVYVHPFQDGNGRVHRCLIHHLLAEHKVTPPGLVFPVFSVMLDRIEQYQTVLHAYSDPLMDFINWRATANHNAAFRLICNFGEHVAFDVKNWHDTDGYGG